MGTFLSFPGSRTAHYTGTALVFRMTLKDRYGSFCMMDRTTATRTRSTSTCLNHQAHHLWRHKERMVTDMKHDKPHPVSTGILIGVVIAILALVRGPWQTGLLLGTFILWGIWTLAALIRPRAHKAKRRPRHRHFRKRLTHAKGGPDISAWISETDHVSAETLLLRHVNHRISACLRSAYPGITWEWEEKKPEKLALSGGTGRIRIFGVSDFDHADITLDQQGGISCSMLRIVPLSDDGSGTTQEEHTAPGRQPIDPQVWYELQGRAVLEVLVSDLNSRGHSCLILHENGDVCVEEDQQEVPKEHLAGFPAKTYWPRLVEVLESNGLTAEATPGGIRVCW